MEIAGVVLGPLPPATRARVRSLLYQVFEPLPPGGEHDFLESLADDFFIPNGDQLQALTSELTEIAKNRFAEFVQKFILRLGEYVLASLGALIRQAIEFILDWEKNLSRALQDLAAALRDLDQTISQLNSDVIALMQACRNGFHQLFQTLGNNTLRLGVANAIKDAFVDKVLDALGDNDVYKALPAEWRAQSRALANGAVDAVVNSPVLTPIFGAIGQLADQLDTLMPDFRELDPDDNLPEQVMLLILDRIEDNIRASFGGDDPHISPAIDLSYRVLVYDFPFGSHWETRHVHIPLGRIEVDLDGMLDVVRDAISALDFYHDALNAACFRLADALAAELELAAAGLTRYQKQREHDRLATLDRENTNAPKEVVILSPTALCCYTSAIDVRVHLGGVPMSYLGLKKDEAPRVLIYVNGTLIPMKSLVVESALSVRDPALHRIEVDPTRLVDGNLRAMSGRAPFAGNNSVIRNGKAFVVPDTARHFAGQPGARAKAMAGTAVPFSTKGLKEEPVARAVYKRVDRRETKRPIVNQSFASRNGRLVTAHGIVNTLAGRRMPPSKIGEVLDASIPGVFVGFTLELDEPFVAEGVNVITVVVIDRGGNRHQHNVSFTIAQPAASAKPAPGVIHAGSRVQIVTLRGLMTQRKLVSNDEEVRRNTRALVGRAVGDEAAPRKAPAAARRIAGQARKLVTLVKRERVEIADARGNVQTLTLRYHTTAERTRQLADLKLDAARLAKARRRLKTVDVAFEKADPRETASPEIKSLVPFSEELLARRSAEAGEYLKQQFALTFGRTARAEGNADAL